MSRVVDARGLACPQPVILTRKAMAEAGDLVTIVNSETSRDNVRRMVEKSGRSVRIENEGDDIHLYISAVVDQDQIAANSTAAPEPITIVEAIAEGPVVLLVQDMIMGRGSEELGQILVRSFFHTLGELEQRPDTVIFINNGVWLTIDESPVLEDLQALETQGVTLLACGTCLDYYDIQDRLLVGQVSNMYEIVETMLAAAKVICL